MTRHRYDRVILVDLPVKLDEIEQKGTRDELDKHTADLHLITELIKVNMHTQPHAYRESARVRDRKRARARQREREREENKLGPTPLWVPGRGSWMFPCPRTLRKPKELQIVIAQSKSTVLRAYIRNCTSSLFAAVVVVVVVVVTFFLIREKDKPRLTYVEEIADVLFWGGIWGGGFVFGQLRGFEMVEYDRVFMIDGDTLV